MANYRFLTNDDRAALYQCFLAAFSDYLVDMWTTAEQFAQRLTRDGVELELSAGAFVNDEMVGFYMNGIGSWQGVPTVYDAGTGVVPEHRRKGVAQELFNFLLPRLRTAGLNQYLLEVLSNNDPAVTLYRRLGFLESRRLAVFRSPEVLRPDKRAAGVEIREIETPDWDLYQTFWDGYPSWQNSIAAINRLTGGRFIAGAFTANECVGYGVMVPATGSVLQLATARSHRRKGIGSMILRTLQEQVPSAEPLKVNNIDFDLSSALAFYHASGFKLALSQSEMLKQL
ncbi:MAG TPA: GNAT family N-acetyltransferase [Pyrinomonadaceae bacterium]|nr:GNAT family N-acetyltransferase [Pyrinomonadaceae bacterium]